MVDKKLSTMETLTLDRKALKLLGIIADKHKPYYFKISHVASVITPVIFLSPIFWYFFTHLNDVGEATGAFYMICIVGMASVTYSEYWFKRPTLLSILKRIQMLVDNASSDCRPIYEQTEFITYHIVHYFKLFIFCSVFSVVSLPVTVLIIVSIIGGDTTKLRILPASLK